MKYLQLVIVILLAIIGFVVLKCSEIRKCDYAFIFAYAMFNEICELIELFNLI